MLVMVGEQMWMEEVAVSGSVPLMRTLRGLGLATEGSWSRRVKSRLSPRSADPPISVPMARSRLMSCHAVARYKYQLLFRSELRWEHIVMQFPGKQSEL